MKSFPKILTILFLSIFIIQLASLTLLLILPQVSQAAEIKYAPQVEIPGYTFNPADKTTGNIANLIKAIYNYAIGIVGILAAVVLMVGGVLWIVAGGNSSQIGEAKAWIGAALTGLILALTSYLILSTINPALVNLQKTDIKSVAEFETGSCTPTENPCIDNYTAGNCKTIYGSFVKGGKCPTGSCSRTDLGTGKIYCVDNSTEGTCSGGSFIKGGKCPKECVQNKVCYYSARFDKTCEQLGQITYELSCCQGKTLPSFCNPEINNCYCCCAP